MKITLRITSREAYSLLNIVNLHIPQNDQFNSNIAVVHHAQNKNEDDRICLEIEKNVSPDFNIGIIFQSITKELIIWRPGERIFLKSDIPDHEWFDFEPHEFKIRTNADLLSQYKKHREIPENENVLSYQDD